MGAPGTVAGVTLLDATDVEPSPSAFTALTVKVYAVPFARPVTVMGEAVPDAGMAPGLEVTVYDVIAEPPLDAGAVKLTVA